MVGEALDPTFGLVNRVAVRLQRDVLRREGDTEIGQPPTIGTGPAGAPRIAATLPEHERFHAVLGVRALAHGILAGADEIPQRLIVRRGNVDRGALARAMQPGLG